MSVKQEYIKSHLKKNKQSTISDIMQNMPFEYHHNSHKYLGDILSRMVNKGMIIRIKKGVFRLPNESDYKQEPNTLF